jgi:Zn-dependent protease with chaperone function
MKAVKSLYPPAPSGLPADLAVPNARYRRLVLLVLFSLVVFFVVYLGFVAGSAWLVYWTWITPVNRFPASSWILKGGALALEAFLFFFLIRGLFRRQRVNRSLMLEVTEQDEPQLFGFIGQLCQDTSTPRPRRVYLSPEVNAAAFCDSSLFSLLLPMRHNLIIGMGLVNVVTLNEFKAVLAHEFGHFSMRGLPLGRFVYLANRIMDHMGYGLYSWECFLWDRCRSGVAGAILCFLPFGVLWLLRQALAAVFRGINLASLALSRQEEFHADLVAVSVTGSDALIHALTRLDFASDSLEQACADLAMTADQQMYSRDLFFHQLRAGDHLRVSRKDKQLGLPPELPADPQAKVQVFKPGTEGIPPMWSDHPPNHDREQNAKRLYVRSPRDERSPWLLFREAEALRTKMTKRWYRTVFRVKKPELSEPETIQTFIDGERAETTYDPKYHGLYDGRFIEPGPLNKLKELAAASVWTRERIRTTLDAVSNETLSARMDEYRQRLEDRNLLSGLLQGRPPPKKGRYIEIRGKSYAIKDKKGLKKLLNRVQKELDADFEHFGTLDRDMFLAHYQMSTSIPGATEELLTRYDFHLSVQEFLGRLSGHQDRVNAVFAYMTKHGAVRDEAAVQAVEIFRDARDARLSAHRQDPGTDAGAAQRQRGGTVRSEAAR